MATFLNTIRPTPFGIYDADSVFQTDADSMVLFVKRILGDDVLSCELTSKQIWCAFEEASMEYSRHIQELKIRSDLVQVLGQPTGSNYTNIYPNQTLEYLMRMAEPYATAAAVGGSYNASLGYIDLVQGKQDYDIYTELKSDVSPSQTLFETLPSGSKGKMRIAEVFHFEPSAAQRTLLNASNLTNFLATNMNYESYVNSTVFYVLPVFEDVLRRGMLEYASRVRRSQFSWEIIGTKLRIYPIPTSAVYLGRLYIKIMPKSDPLNPAFQDDSINGVSGPHNFPFSVLPYSSITQPGKQWIRQYCLALCTEILGRIRSKFQTIPIPNADLQLNGEGLVSQAREDKEKLITQLKDFLENLTNEKLIEQQANIAANINKQLRYVPMPLGKAITIR